MNRRRAFFRYLIGLGLITFAAPEANAKTAKAIVKYQTTPHGEQRCDRCLHFNPKNNTCRVVEGSITPEGWCTIFVKKPNAAE